jgi:predicted permease
MNTLIKNWQFACLAYVLCALAAAPIYMKDVELALPFYSAQCFIVIMTCALTFMFLGLERILDELDGFQQHVLYVRRPHQS